VVFGLPDAGVHRQEGGAKAPTKSIITPALIMLTLFFTLLGLSNAGIGNFGVVALMSGYGASFPTANMALTAYLGASTVGVPRRRFSSPTAPSAHGQVAAGCFAVNAAIVLLIAAVALPPLLLAAAMTTPASSVASSHPRAT